MADLKKKFIDILFEDPEGDVVDDTEEIVAEAKAEVKDIKNETIKSQDDEVVLNAKDILYRKPTNSTFINLDDPVAVNNSNSNSTPLKDEAFEFTAQISPMFGVVKPNRKKPAPIAPEITECQTNRPVDSHLDIITSPIYGYGNKEDALMNNYDVKAIGDEYQDEQELNEIFDDSIKQATQDDDSELSLDDLDDVSLFRLFGDSK